MLRTATVLFVFLLMIATTHLPLLRRIGISPNESAEIQENIPAAQLSGWDVCSPETAGRFSSIGYTFASRIQRATQIPIGIIDNARGGACMESWVPQAEVRRTPHWEGVHRTSRQTHGRI